MPSTKNFEKKDAKKESTAPGDAQDLTNESKAKRRPGRDPEMQAAPGDTHGDVIVVDVELDSGASESVATAKRPSEFASSAQSKPSGNEKSEKDEKSESKFELNFKGSEMLRAQFPKPFEVAEKVAGEWVHDGRFEGLPLGHPLVQYFAAKGLRRAKDLEKKVLESPATEKFFTQAFTLGLKAQEIISQVSAKVRK